MPSSTYDLVGCTVPAGSVNVEEFLVECLVGSAAKGFTCFWSSLLECGSLSFAIVWTSSDPLSSPRSSLWLWLEFVNLTSLRPVISSEAAAGFAVEF